MGLDMYANSVPAEASIDDFSFIPDEATEIAYWHKHNALHGWMHELFIAKGGTGDFNCQPIRLTEDTLKELRTRIKNKSLTCTSGFFFGGTYEYDDRRAERDLQFVLDALTIVRSGGAVYYDSYW